MSEQMSLLTVEPEQGRTRASDPQTSVEGAKRSNARTQRRVIAAALLVRPYVTADWLADQDHANQAHRSIWSSRLAGLVKDGLLERSQPVQGPKQFVLSYVLTDAGRVWARQLCSEGRAA